MIIIYRVRVYYLILYYARVLYGNNHRQVQNIVSEDVSRTRKGLDVVVIVVVDDDDDDDMCVTL